MLNRLEKYLGWLAVPKIGILFITLQAAGFLMVQSNSAWIERLALLPDRVMAGELWRLITFLALPLSNSPIWVIFVLWFLYFVFESVENAWGSFKTTLYVLVSILVTIAYSLLTGHPVLTARHFESTLFLAAALLLPDVEILFFFVVPAKLKWLAGLSVFFVTLEWIQASWLDRGLVLAVYSNFLIFFGPMAWEAFRNWRRRR